MKLDLLAFGAHPDDVEIGAGGLVALHGAKGYQTGICDLTEGEMSSNGTVEGRRIESQMAGKFLGIQTRLNLQLSDRNLRLTQEDIRPVVETLRQHRPTVILAPHPDDRHPDHGWCARIVREAFFSSGLRHYVTGDLAPYRPRALYYYFINDTHPVSLCVDVSSVYERKKQALSAYGTQFFAQQGQAATPLNSGAFLRAVEGRDAMFGAQLGTMYAEGLVAPNTIGITDLVELRGMEAAK